MNKQRLLCRRVPSEAQKQQELFPGGESEWCVCGTSGTTTIPSDSRHAGRRSRSWRKLAIKTSCNDLWLRCPKWRRRRSLLTLGRMDWQRGQGSADLHRRRAPRHRPPAPWRHGLWGWVDVSIVHVVAVTDCVCVHKIEVECIRVSFS